MSGSGAGWDAAAYHAFFTKLHGFTPHAFQGDAARRLAERQNLVLRAPTGAGKTATVLTPFFFDRWWPKPRRLIYAVPLRTLAQGILQEARALAKAAGMDPCQVVTLQTGEQPDDPYFTRGRVIVTTYDQVLSGLLSGPYGLSPRSHNLNAAAVAGALVVFDEFHLMEPQRAFLTGAAGLHVFRQLTQSIWMTATATSPLCDVLAQAIGCQDASPSEQETASLLSVATVRRRLTFSDRPLTAEAVLGSSAGRTLVICNTVGRAQRLYREVRAALEKTGQDVPVMLLHARFFKSHREAKVARLAQHFRRGRGGRAILIATQVVEAGIDISCDDLHTELCPMNALVQRAGRCARYENEAGRVHVYALPEEARSWLPYGTLQRPDPSLAATRPLLSEVGPGDPLMTPSRVAEWVERVHADADRQTLREGWVAHAAKVVDCIRQNSIERLDVRVTPLIREESLDDVRVIVSDAARLPARPGQREALTISRWSIERALTAGGAGSRASVAWIWTFDRDAGWTPLTAPEQMRTAAVVCLAPTIAGYSDKVGLELGGAGTEESPDRAEPPRPGWGRYKREPWHEHARAVAAEAARRADDDGLAGWLGEGLLARYGCTSDEIRQVVCAAGLLHDLGKLQRGWQDWAEAWQRSKDPTYRHAAGLAHTDYDPNDPADRAANKAFSPRKPNHAAAGAFVAAAILPDLLKSVARERLGGLASSCLAAIVAHHGGWLPEAADLGLQPLWSRWEHDLRGAGIIPPSRQALQRLFDQPNRARHLRGILDLTTMPERLHEWWPLVAYVTRTLRLSDWRATEEGSADD